LYYGLKDIKRKLLNKLYYRLKSIRSPGGKRTSFYIRVDNSLLILLFGITKQLSVFVSKVDKFNKKNHRSIFGIRWDYYIFIIYLLLYNVH